jgi:thiol-disulfide isomerase/thioredoxin
MNNHPLATGLGSGLARALFCTLFLLFTGIVNAASPPQLGQRGLQDWSDYQHAEGHKAFAIAPGGAWAWVVQRRSLEAAEALALSQCEQRTEQRCTLFALDDTDRFDPAQWAKLWRLESGEATTRVGIKRGQLFPNLRFYSADGTSASLRALRDNLTVVHFWGSWCPPCMAEFPHLQAFYQQLQAIPNTRMVLLQVRETHATSVAWAKKHGFNDLPLFDSGGSADTNTFKLADDTTLPDRYLAPGFPTSYVLDQNGRVLFAHRGPVSDWNSLLPLLRDMAMKKIDR